MCREAAIGEPKPLQENNNTSGIWYFSQLADSRGGAFRLPQRRSHSGCLCPLRGSGSRVVLPKTLESLREGESGGGNPEFRIPHMRQITILGSRAGTPAVRHPPTLSRGSRGERFRSCAGKRPSDRSDPSCGPGRKWTSHRVCRGLVTNTFSGVIPLTRYALANESLRAWTISALVVSFPLPPLSP